MMNIKKGKKFLIQIKLKNKVWILMILFKVQKAIEIKVFRLIKMVVRVICRIILFNKLIFKILNRMNKLKLKNLIIKAIRIKINKL